MNQEWMDPEELLEEFWRASDPEQEKRDPKYPRKLSPREMRLRTAIVLIVLLVAGAVCWPLALIGTACMDVLGEVEQSICEARTYAELRPWILGVGAIVGVVAILLLMWGRGWMQRLMNWWGRKGG